MWFQTQQEDTVYLAKVVKLLLKQPNRTLDKRNIVIQVPMSGSSKLLGLGTLAKYYGIDFLATDGFNQLLIINNDLAQKFVTQHLQTTPNKSKNTIYIDTLGKWHQAVASLPPGYMALDVEFTDQGQDLPRLELFQLSYIDKDIQALVIDCRCFDDLQVFRDDLKRILASLMKVLEKPWPLM